MVEDESTQALKLQLRTRFLEINILFFLLTGLIPKKKNKMELDVRWGIHFTPMPFILTISVFVFKASIKMYIDLWLHVSLFLFIFLIFSGSPLLGSWAWWPTLVSHVYLSLPANPKSVMIPKCESSGQKRFLSSFYTETCSGTSLISVCAPSMKIKCICFHRCRPQWRLLMSRSRITKGEVELFLLSFLGVDNASPRAHDTVPLYSKHFALCKLGNTDLNLASVAPGEASVCPDHACATVMTSYLLLLTKWMTRYLPPSRKLSHASSRFSARDELYGCWPLTLLADAPVTL